MPGPHKKVGDKHKKGEDLSKDIFLDTINVDDTSKPISRNSVSSSSSSSVSMSEREFEKQFEKFLRENITDPVAQEKMRALSKESKWKLIAQASAMKSNSSKTAEKLKRMEDNLRGSPTVEQLESLRLDLEQSDSSVIDQFIKKVGFGPLLNLLVKYSMAEPTKEIQDKQRVVMRCLRGINNFRIFFIPFQTHPLSVKACVLTLTSLDPEARERALELLISLIATKTGSGPIIDYLELQAASNGSNNLMSFTDLFLEKKSRSVSVQFLCVFLNALFNTSSLSSRKLIYDKLKELKTIDKIDEYGRWYKLEADRMKASRTDNKKGTTLQPSIISNQDEVIKRYLTIVSQIEIFKKSLDEINDEVKKMGNVDASSDNFNRIIDSLIYDMNSDPNYDKFEETIKNLKLISKKSTKKSGSYAWRAIEGLTRLIYNNMAPLGSYLRSKEFKKDPIAPTDDIWEVLKLFNIGKNIMPANDSKVSEDSQPVKELEDGRFSLSQDYYKNLVENMNSKLPELEAQAKTLKINIETLEKENNEMKEKMASLNNQLSSMPKGTSPNFAAMPKFMEGSTTEQAPPGDKSPTSSTPITTTTTPAMGTPSQPAQTSRPAMGMGVPAMGAPAMGKPVMAGPAMGQPAMGQPAMGQPAMGGAAMGKPAMGMGAPAMGAPKMGAPAMGVPKMGMGVPKMGMGVPGPAKPAKPKKKNEKPDVPVKKIMWERIADQNVDKTFWNTYGLEDEVVELEDIKREFSLENMMKAEKESSDTPSAIMQTQKAKSMAIIPANKSKNMSISLTRTRKSCEEIKRAIIEMDSSVLSQDHLESLSKNAIPDQEDVEKVREYLDSNPGDLEKLPLAEKYVSVISTVPNFSERIINWAFTLNFESQLTVLTNELDILILSFTALKDSSKFKKFLRITLAVGNYMNGGTPQGGAYGFKLGTLSSLRTCKDIEGRRTLLNYILNICYDLDQKKPPSEEWNDYETTIKSEGYDNFDLRDMHSTFLKEANPILGFIVELSLFIEAKNIGIKENKRDLTELTNNFEKVKRSIDNMPIADENDNYVAVMQEFVSQNSSKVENVNNMSAKLDKLYSDICTQFGENPDVLTPADLVAKIASFIDNCEVSLNENKSDRESKILSSRKAQSTKGPTSSEDTEKKATKESASAGASAQGKSDAKPGARAPRGSRTTISRQKEELGLPLSSMGNMSDGMGAGLLDDLMNALTDGDGFKTLRRRKR